MDRFSTVHIAVLCRLASSYGIHEVVVSPGSRNAPVTAVFARYGAFRLRYVVDERSAAFVALGIAVTTRRPVALICTSGSAVMDYGPALAEALYHRVPLLAVTADRPAEAIGKRLPQTMVQPGALAAVTLGHLDICAAMDLTDLNARLNGLFWKLTGAIPGPVHVNVRVTEPFAFPATIEIPSQARKIPPVAPGDKEYAGILGSFAGRKLLAVFGGMSPDEVLAASVRSLTADNRIQAIAEAQANLPFLPAPDAVDFKALAPDAVLRAGGAPVSKALVQWLRRSGVPVYDVGHDISPADVTGTLRAVFQTCPANFFRELAHIGLGQTEPVPLRALPDFPEREAVKEILASAPAGMALHLSNGLTIRAVQGLDTSKFTAVEANRGVSGIDGCTSTAVGAAMASEGEVLFISGDMSAAYDLAALAIDPFPANFRMAVLNNGDGAIFGHVADLRDVPEAESYCRRMPRFPLRELAAAYKFNYTGSVTEFFTLPAPVILDYKIKR